MGKVQKKNNKGRLDRYYYLAKEKGYRARSSFKIIQINEKFGHFLEKSKVVIDLCAAPGSWCQVVSQICPINSLIIGVDIVPMKPIPNVITFQSDITTEDCRSRLRGYMKTWKADTVLHDGAPNVGLNWIRDAFTQSHLTLQALKLAVENLVVGGNFITKVFRSRDYNKLIWVFKQLFAKVEATKPPASRNVSAEIFVVCKGFKAPKKLDPRLLDPKEVFEELPDGSQNMQAKVYNPEKKTRKRGGYEEGDYLLYHEAPIMDFVRVEDPIQMLGEMNKFIIDKEDHEWKLAKKLKQTTPEFKECIKDLKVLGKKDFKMLLKWRKTVRILLGLDKEKEVTEIQVASLDKDEEIDKELDELQEKQRLIKKRQKRKQNELRQKQIIRMQMKMLTSADIGIEAASLGRDLLFNLKTAEKTGILDKLAKGKKSMVFSKEELDIDTDIQIDRNALLHERDEFVDTDELQSQLDLMYSQYKARKAEKNPNFKAKQARDNDDDQWDGFESKSNEEEITKSDYENSNSELSDSDYDDAINTLIAKNKDNSSDNKLSSKARTLFNDPLFDCIESDVPKSESLKDSTLKERSPVKMKERNFEVINSDSSDSDSSDDGNDFQIVPNECEEHPDDDLFDEKKDAQKDKHAKDIEIATAEAMTLAHQLALGQKSKHDLIDESFNKYSFHDTENLPEWFIEDESKHSKINRPITKEAVIAIKEKMKALNARPIKKVSEAMARKKMRASARLEKIKKKAGMINDDSNRSEKDKADEISKLMGRIKKTKQKPRVKVIFAKGKNKGLSGRPKGVKGKYKMIDGVSKNEQRALRRIAKKYHKR